MRGCGCGCLLMLGSVLLFVLVVFLALQPINETPPLVSKEAAASFDSKLAGLLAAQGRGNIQIAVSEEELNSKLAATMQSAPGGVPLRSVFMRFRPENRIQVFLIGEALGRPFGGSATLALSTVEGKLEIKPQEAKIGALPIPVGLLTGLLGTALQSAGLEVSPAGGLPQGIQSARIEGNNLVLSSGP